jgi:hypothetical protein
MRTLWMFLVGLAVLGLGAPALQAQCCGGVAYATYYTAPSCSTGSCDLGGCGCSSCFSSGCSTCGYSPTYYTSYYTPYYASYPPYYAGWGWGRRYWAGYGGWGGCCGW